MNAFEIFPSEASKSLERIIQEQYYRLTEIVAYLETPINLSNFIEKISAEIDSRAIDSDTISQLNLERLIAQNPETSQIRQFEIACIALACTKKIFSSGNLDSAWPLTCHTNYLIGTVERQTELFEAAKKNFEKAKSNKTRAQKGGAATKDQYTKIRSHMAGLLMRKAPDCGWISKKSAVDSILGALEEFVTQTDLNLPLPDLHATATKWLQRSGDLEINEAYEKSSAKYRSGK